MQAHSSFHAHIITGCVLDAGHGPRHWWYTPELYGEGSKVPLKCFKGFREVHAQIWILEQLCWRTSWEGIWLGRFQGKKTNWEAGVAVTQVEMLLACMGAKNGMWDMREKWWVSYLDGKLGKILWIAYRRWSRYRNEIWCKSFWLE